MKVLLIGVGRLKNGPERELFERYFSRAGAIARSCGVASLTVRELEEGRAHRAEERKSIEARTMLDLLPKGSRLALLDEAGPALTSTQFATAIASARDAGASAFVLAIGGPDGHGPEIRTRCDLSISFGAMTWPHQLVRVMAAEQLYRAFTILTGHPYHRT